MRFVSGNLTRLPFFLLHDLFVIITSKIFAFCRSTRDILDPKIFTTRFEKIYEMIKTKVRNETLNRDRYRYNSFEIVVLSNQYSYTTKFIKVRRAKHRDAKRIIALLIFSRKSAVQSLRVQPVVIVSTVSWVMGRVKRIEDKCTSHGRIMKFNEGLQASL